MSFFRNLKKSLGFDAVEDDLLEDTPETNAANDDDTIQPIQPTTISAKLHDHDLPAADPAKVDMIFSHVVEMFNQALPNFLQGSVNADAQRKQLYDSLDTSIKEYLDTLAGQTLAVCQQRLADEQASMRDEIASLRSKAKEIEQQRFDIKQQQLSADRQKRALTDRLHDLENQIGRLEAEREQFDLENKSLLNKLKVSAVHEAEIETLQQQLNDSKAENLRLKQGELAPDASDEIAKLNNEIASLQDQLNQAAEKDQIGSEMLNGLQSKASELRQSNDELNKKLADVAAELEQTKHKLAEAETSREEIENINLQINQVEELIDARDKKIKQLKETCRSLKQENESLNQTIATNLKTHAESEASLAAEIDRLKAKVEQLEQNPIQTVNIDAHEIEIDEQIAAKSPENEPIKISDGDLEAIDESFDTCDWMRNDPPQTQSMRASLSDEDFGYQAPTKKTPRPDNDAQLTLF